MIHKNIEFFDVAELVPYDGGYRLERYPENIRKTKTGDAARIMSTATCCELRFVTDATVFDITLGGGIVYIMIGDIIYRKVELSGRKTIKVIAPAQYDLCGKVSKVFPGNLWRIFSDEECPLTFYDIMPIGKGEILPPTPEVLPAKKMLIYGSSITHWCWAIDSRNSYAYRAGHLMGMDVMNKALAGSCDIGKDSIDYLATLDADVIFMELGINVIEHIDEEEFEKRVTYAFENLPKDKEIYVTGIYDYFKTLSPGYPIKEKFDAFNRIVKETAEKYEWINYIDPKKIMSDPRYLCYDMLHPSDFGHIEMSQNLVNEIQKIRESK